MDNNTYLLIVIVLLILVIAFLLWSKKQTNDDFDELFDGLDVEFKGNEKNFKGMNESIKETNALLETYNKVIDSKSLEIEEYKEANLLGKQKGLFTSLIGILNFIDKFNLEIKDLNENTKNYLIALKDKLEIILSSAGIEKYIPQINKNIMDIEGCNPSHNTKKTSDVSKTNLISKVLQPGYCLQVSGNKIIFIKNAEVEVFELEKK
jgi:hypothetical protein|tara:strand:+ start:729 stop:1349 length:621 start_codon:yes stop_codon:yes gene_type:complete